MAVSSKKNGFRPQTPLVGTKPKVLKAQKQKTKHTNFLSKMTKQKEQSLLAKCPKTPLDLSTLSHSLLETSKLLFNDGDKATTAACAKGKGKSVSTTGKKYLFEREKKRLEMIVSDPIFKADPIKAIQSFLDYRKCNS
jgi:hypothetical protein